VLRLHLIQMAKYAGVLLFVGGAIAAFVARELEARRVAVHKVGSPGLLLTWAGGYLLSRELDWPFFEPWLLGAFITTVLAQVVLTWSVAREDRRSRGAGIAVALLVVATLALMVWKPTWRLFS